MKRNHIARHAIARIARAEAMASSAPACAFAHARARARAPARIQPQEVIEISSGSEGSEERNKDELPIILQLAICRILKGVRGALQEELSDFLEIRGTGLYIYRKNLEQLK